MSRYFVWIYVLESRDRRHWTVGAARNLAACFEQYAPKQDDAFPNRLVAVYKFCMPRDLNDGMGASHPHVVSYENHITGQMMRRVGSEWYNVNSTLGIFRREDAMPEEMKRGAFPVTCFCGYPAELREGKNGGQYYCCPRNHRDWILREPFPDFICVEATRACGFYAVAKLYQGDKD